MAALDGGAAAPLLPLPAVAPPAMAVGDEPVFDEAGARARFLAALSAALRGALDSFDAECPAAVAIQAAFRGYFSRTRLREMGYYAREIQRVFRGHMGRRRARALINAARASHAAARAACAARAIQRVFRGFRSRKYRHDFYARKAYIAAVTAKGDALRAASQQALEEQLQVRGGLRQQPAAKQAAS